MGTLWEENDISFQGIEPQLLGRSARSIVAYIDCGFLSPNIYYYK
jgi:hypothetical protein